MIIGVDPGLSGAIAFLSPRGLIDVADMPVADKRVDPVGLANLIGLHAPGPNRIAIVEAVHSMPKQGLSSTFTFGQAFGTVLGVIGALKIPVRMSTPAKWKAFHRIGAEKDKARYLAISTWPDMEPQFKRKRDNGRAEAALIALYMAHILKAEAR